MTWWSPPNLEQAVPPESNYKNSIQETVTFLMTSIADNLVIIQVFQRKNPLISLTKILPQPVGYLMVNMQSLF